jgi:acyl-CoA thioesterase
MDGLEHDFADSPQVPGPDELASVDELQKDSGGPRHSFFDNLEERPISWIADYEHRPAGDPVHRCWYRFRPTPTFTDHWVDAGRLAIVVDTFQWPAASRAYAAGSLDHIAPSLDLACRFHRMEGTADADWLLVEARAPIATEGLVGGTADVWDERGRLLASGGQQMLCRRN